MNYWLLKSEPDEFGIDDLAAAPRRTAYWEGVRNYQARNMLRDEMRRGDRVFFYHSNCALPAIAGIARVTKKAYADHTAFDPDSKYFDPKSDPENPRWFMVDIAFVRKLRREILLSELKEYADGPLSGMLLLRRGNRLSVTPVSDAHWQFILSLE